MAIPYQGNPLAQRLRAARGTRRNKELSLATGWPPSKISKIEGGRQLPTQEDLAAWASATGVSQNGLDQWVSMLEQIQAEEHQFRDEFLDGQRRLQREYNQMIDIASDYQFYEKVFVPRFLQTPAYTRALLEEGHRIHRPDVDLRSAEAQHDLDEAVSLRQASTQYLFDTARTFQLIFDEAVLRTWRFSHEIMHAQLLRLQSVIGLPNVRLGIYPQNTLVSSLNINSFEIYGEIVCIEHTLGDDYRIRTDDVAGYREQMDRLWRDSVEGDQAHQLISQAIQAIPH